MTISTQIAEVTLPGNGATTSFAYSFLISESTDAVVTVTVGGVDTVLTAAQFSISGTGDEAGGTVTYPLSGSPLANGSTITIQRVLPIVQEFDIVNQGTFNPSDLEGALDYLTMLAQQLQYQIDGTVVPSVQAIQTPQGRLSLTSGTPVTVSDVTVASSVFYEPYHGSLLPLWDGSTFIMVPFTEITLLLDLNFGHVGYQESGKNFDVFAVDSVTIGTGPAWTSDTGRGTGAGTTELELKSGIFTNKNEMTIRFGSVSGNIVTVDANAATYLGTIRMTANGKTEDSFVKRFVWNCYNRAPRGVLVQDATNSWTYSTAAFRQANGSTANQFAMVRGLNEDVTQIKLIALVSSSTSTPRTVAVALGLDSVITRSLLSVNANQKVDNVAARPVGADYSAFPGLGYHYIAWLEYGGGTDTQTWYGDDGTPTFIQTGMTGQCLA